MMAWFALLFLIGTAIAILWLMGLRGGFLTGSAAALLLGASGYALQGSPGLPSAPARSGEGHEVIPLTDARHAFYGYFTPAETWLRMSEALERDGKSEDAVGILQNAVNRYPGDPQLWIGLGNALVDHARSITPPAEMAYKRAEEAAPAHPGARFFYGLALARTGDRETALALWRQILATAPKDAAWRSMVENGVVALSGAPHAAQGRGVSPSL